VTHSDGRCRLPTLRNTASYAIAHVDYAGTETARLKEFEIRCKAVRNAGDVVLRFPL
jgi:hypothetical protein